MTQVCLLMLLAALCIQHAVSRCDLKVLKEIKLLRQYQDDSDILSTLPGDYDLVYISAGSLVDQSEDVACPKVTYTKTANGYSVHYDGVSPGTYSVTYSAGSLYLLDDNGDVVKQNYIVYQNGGVLAFYSCSFSKSDLPVGAVIVPSGSSDSLASQIQEAIASLQSVGIKDGVNLTPCSGLPLSTGRRTNGRNHPV